MFKDSQAFSGFAATDLDSVEPFYRDTLGLETNRNEMGILEVKLGSGATVIMVYPKPDFEPATYTILNFPVDDIEAAVDAPHVEGRADGALRQGPMQADAQGHLPRRRPDDRLVQGPGRQHPLGDRRVAAAGLTAHWGSGAATSTPAARASSMSARRISSEVAVSPISPITRLTPARDSRPAIDPRRAGDADLLAPDVDRDRQRRRVAVDLLAAGADHRQRLGDLVRRHPVEVELVGVPGGQSPCHVRPVATDHDRHPRLLDGLGDVARVTDRGQAPSNVACWCRSPASIAGDHLEVVAEPGEALRVSG